MVGSILTLTSGTLQAYGQIKEGEAEASAAEYNAQLSELNAGQVIAQTNEQIRQLRVIGRKTLGDIRASYGASGVTMEGSALDVLAESAASAEMDVLNKKYEGDLQAANLRNSASIDRAKAANIRAGSKIGAVATLLGSGAAAAKGR